MAAVARCIADTSALARLGHTAVAEALGPLIEAGLVAPCGVVEFKLGRGARTSAEFDRLRADRDLGYEWLPTLDEDWRRALDVQAELWRRGPGRAGGFPHPLLAAGAAPGGGAVGHADSQYRDILAR